MRNLHAFVMEKRYNGVWFIKSTYTISTYCLLVHVALLELYYIFE